MSLISNIISILFICQFGHCLEKEFRDPKDIERLGNFTVDEFVSGLAGVTWLENKIYVVLYNSNKIYVYADQPPFDKYWDEGIRLYGMKSPRDMEASAEFHSIFISDDDSKCIWFSRLGKKGRRDVDGQPGRLSITPSNNLLVYVWRDPHHYLDIFRLPDLQRTESIKISSDITELYDAIQLSTGNFIISHEQKNWTNAILISELSSDGTNILRTFDPKSVGWTSRKNWWPNHLSLDDTGRILIGDLAGTRVIVMNSRLTDHQILLDKHRHQIDRPSRLSYVPEKRMLIVGHAFTSQSVSVFKLGP